jgi:integrase
LRAQEAVAARALEFLILTAARSGEVLGACWDELDFAEKVWTVPAGRTKGGREHRVPLSDDAVAVLSKVPREGGNDRSMKRADITVHGFRSTFRDWAAERTNFANFVVEMALAHAVDDKTESSYRRGDLLDKRRELMKAWATYCSKPPATGDVVVPIGAGR